MEKSKILIAYFSLKGETYVNGKIAVLPQGNTEVVAKRLSAMIKTDLFHIMKKGGYPDTYRGVVEVAKEEWRNDTRPELAEVAADVRQYDTIILGYPNWCNTMPKAVCTFLEASDFSGKKIVPFCTHEGSGLGNSIEDLRKICPHSILMPGTAIHGAEAGEVWDELQHIISYARETE